MKLCRSCKILKPLEEFHKYSKSPDGRQYMCKPCSIAAALLSAKKNPEAKREADRKYRQTEKYKANRKARREGPQRETILAQKRASWARNRDLLTERKREWEKANAEHVRERRHRYYLDNRETISERNNFWQREHLPELRHYRRERMYGLTREEFERLMVDQEGLCAICKVHMDSVGEIVAGYQRTGICVDHDHATGKVRGLLCSGCNKALGLMKDDAVRLRAAADYLDRNNLEVMK